MRTLPLLAGLMLAAALVSFVPSASASMKACTDLKDASCPATLCVDDNGDRRYTSDECAGRYDPCRFQSDCCSTTGGLWCPEHEES